MIIYKQKKPMMEVLKTFDLEEIPNPHKISVRARKHQYTLSSESNLPQAG